MPIELTNDNDGRLIHIRASGRLTSGDYRKFLTVFEECLASIEHPSVMFEMEDFHGWDASALWQDLKFDLRHYTDIDRVAFVGDRKWEKWMAAIYRPFTAAETRYFDRSKIDAARLWLAPEPAMAGGYINKDRGGIGILRTP